MIDDHKCYLRSTQPKDDFMPKFINFDFEFRMKERSVREVKRIKKKIIKTANRNRYVNFAPYVIIVKTPLRGKPTHQPNFVVVHTV